MIVGNAQIELLEVQTCRAVNGIVAIDTVGLKDATDDTCLFFRRRKHSRCAQNHDQAEDERPQDRHVGLHDSFRSTGFLRRRSRMDRLLFTYQPDRTHLDNVRRGGFEACPVPILSACDWLPTKQVIGSACDSPVCRRVNRLVMSVAAGALLMLLCQHVFDHMRFFNTSQFHV